MSASEKIPGAVRPQYDEIIQRLTGVCRDHLDDDYATLGRKLAGALARKRPSPIARGRPEIWVAGILHALGMVNFLFDSSQTPHLRAEELARACGVAPSTMSAKSKLIRELFDMFPFDPDWCLPGKIDSNPMIWYLSVDGYIVDVRTAPREIQEEAFRLGLIPYIPADQAKTRPAAAPRPDQPRCGLCGATDKPLTRTACCGNWICDDEDQYVLFSYARNSCHRNHSRYTLCSYHFNEGHTGKWQDCEECRQAFETELYVYFGTNEYNFEKLPNPPAFKPTHCASCGRVISLGHDGYTLVGDKYYCVKCAAKRLPAAERPIPPRQQRRRRR